MHRAKAGNVPGRQTIVGHTQLLLSLTSKGNSPISLNMIVFRLWRKPEHPEKACKPGTFML